MMSRRDGDNSCAFLMSRLWLETAVVLAAMYKASIVSPRAEIVGARWTSPLEERRKVFDVSSTLTCEWWICA